MSPVLTFNNRDSFTSSVNSRSGNKKEKGEKKENEKRKRKRKKKRKKKAAPHWGSKITKPSLFTSRLYKSEHMSWSVTVVDIFQVSESTMKHQEICRIIYTSICMVLKSKHFYSKDINFICCLINITWNFKRKMYDSRANGKTLRWCTIL